MCQHLTSEPVEDWRISELAQLMDKYDISIIAIQEHRRVHEEEIKYEHIGNHLLINSSALRNSSQALVVYVFFLIRKLHFVKSIAFHTESSKPHSLVILNAP